MTARATDPATSHLAATYIDGKRPGLRDAFLMALKTLGPSTANEIADWCVKSGVSANAESVRKRAGDLVNDGLCEWSDARACKITSLNARTVRIANADIRVRTETAEHAKADRRASAGGSGCTRKATGNSGKVRDIEVAGLENQGGQKSVSTPQAEQAKAAVEFVNAERDWIDIWRAAMELSRVAKALGTWPDGTSEQYIHAIEAVAAQGLIERDGGRVRRKRVVVESKVVQKGLFSD